MRMHIESPTGAYTDDLWPQPEEEWLFISSYQLPIINPQLEAGPQGPSAIHGWLLLLCWSYYESLVWVITAAVRWCLQQACYVQKSQLCSQHAGSYVLSAPSSTKFPEPWMRGNDTDSPSTAEYSVLFLLGTAISDESLHWPQPTASCDVKWDSYELPKGKKCVLWTSSQLFL